MHVGYCKVKRSCFRTFGGKVLGIFVLMIRQFHRNESSWNVRSRGTKVARERIFHGTKVTVLGTFAAEERKFHRSESYKERMFHGRKVPRERKFSLWTFRSLERKCRGLESTSLRVGSFKNNCLLIFVCKHWHRIFITFLLKTIKAAFEKSTQLNSTWIYGRRWNTSLSASIYQN